MKPSVDDLFETYGARVYRIGLRFCRSPHDAEEVRQETFLQIIRSLSSLRSPLALESWVLSIARSKALMLLRRERYRRCDALDEGHHHPPAHDVELAIDMAAAMATLPPDWQQILWMHDVEGMSVREIATIFGLSVSNSKARLRRGRLRLRSRLAGH